MGSANSIYGRMHKEFWSGYVMGSDNVGGYVQYQKEILNSKMDGCGLDLSYSGWGPETVNLCTYSKLMKFICYGAMFED
jgi:hypothetical protein